MLREAYCPDVMKKFECQKVSRGSRRQEKLLKKNWMANKYSDSSNTDREPNCNLQHKC
jgi:hypothetical protein